MEITRGWGGGLTSQNFKRKNLNCNFQRDGGFKPKKRHPLARYGYFLEQQNGRRSYKKQLFGEGESYYHT